MLAVLRWIPPARTVPAPASRVSQHPAALVGEHQGLLVLAHHRRGRLIGQKCGEGHRPALFSDAGFETHSPHRCRFHVDQALTRWGRRCIGRSLPVVRAVCSLADIKSIRLLRRYPYTDSLVIGLHDAN
jgi:hypothetical protein